MKVDKLVDLMVVLMGKCQDGLLVGQWVETLVGLGLKSVEMRVAWLDAHSVVRLGVTMAELTADKLDEK